MAPLRSLNFKVLTTRADANGEEKQLALSTLDSIAEAILDERLATEDELRAAVASLIEFTSDPTTIIAGPRIFQVWARRPL